MRVKVVVVHLAQILAGNEQVVGQVVVAGGHSQLARIQHGVTAKAVGQVRGECSVLARNLLNAMVLAHIQLVVGRHLAVVLERLVAGGLGIGAGKGMPPISSSSAVVKKVMCEG